MAKTLLLISEHAEDQQFASEVAMTAGLTLKVAQKMDDGVKWMAQEEVVCVFVDIPSQAAYQALEDAVQAQIGIFSDRIASLSFHFICTQEIEEYPYLVQSPLFSNFMMRNYGEVKKSGEQYGRIVQAMQAERAFGLPRFLKAGAKVQVIKLSQSTQKNAAVDAVRNFLAAAKFQSRMAMTIVSAVDEVLMNAIFDAPVDALGKQIYATTPRSTSFALEGQSAVELHVAYDGELLTLSVVDFFGSLDKARLFSHIAKAYHQEEYKVKASQAGAGVGLGSVFRTGSSFLFISENQVKTEVVVFFRKFQSYRDFRNQFRFLASQFYF
ncbi:MAG: hypothetical protein ACO3A2_07205 [Bdellovibrionia bacterium]